MRRMAGAVRPAMLLLGSICATQSQAQSAPRAHEPAPASVAPVGVTAAADQAGRAAGSPSGISAAAAPAAGVNGDIIVTAQRREQVLVKVPASISAIGGAELVERGLRSTADLQFATPSLSVGGTAVSNLISIRGVGQNQDSPYVQPGVAVHVDGAYQPRTTLSALNQVDLARAEVLRGPQGTLYGRNATGGAVNFITNAPSRSLEASAILGYESYHEVHAQAIVNVPLADGLRMRAVVDYRNRRDGFVRNVVPGLKSVDAPETLVGRLRIAADLTANLTLDVSAYGANTDPSPYITLRSPISAAAITANPFLAAAIVPLTPRRTAANDTNASRRKVAGVTATAVWRPGALKVTSLTNYLHFNDLLRSDSDTSQISAFPQTQRARSNTLTQELDVAASAGLVDLILGGFYMNDHLEQRQTFGFPLGFALSAAARITPGGTLETDALPYTIHSIAGFADGTVNVSPRLRLLVGGRYTRDTVRSGQNVSSGPIALTVAPAPAPPLVIPRSVSCANNFVERVYQSFTPRGGLQWDVSEADNVYVTVSRGFKGGGINGSVCNNSYNPEKVTAFEAGAKGHAANDTVTFGLSGFYYRYTDLQLQQIVGVSSQITNVPSATVKGAEAQAAWRVTPRFALNGSLTLLDSRYGEFVNRDGLNPGLGFQNLSGNVLNRSPKRSGTLGMQYITGENAAWGRFTFRADAYLTSRIYFREFNTAADAQDGYGLLNLNVNWAVPGDRLIIRLFANNVTGSDYITSLAAADPFGSRYVTWGSPFQTGAELRVRF